MTTRKTSSSRRKPATSSSGTSSKTVECGFCGQSVPANKDGTAAPHTPAPEIAERQCPGGNEPES